MPESKDLPVTGQHVPGLESFDRLMASFLAKHKAPGAALAVTRAGKVVYARGFGYADRKTREPVQPTSLFRIASVSKPITAVAVLQLVERGKLKLDDKVFDILKVKPHLEKGAKIEPRLAKVTISHLLHHTGGWDRAKAFDPMFRSVKIAQALGVEPPAEPKHIIRYMMSQPLQSEPGERYAYSNFGFSLLGRVIEARSGLSYEAYVKKHVLAPVGVKAMRIGRTLPEHRAPSEVRYHTHKRQRGSCVFAHKLGKQVPRQYGAWYLEGFDAHGGWIASAVDLVRFASAFDDPAHSPLLSAESIKTMFARPKGLGGYEPNGKPKAAYYGCGWLVRPKGKKANHWHGGGLTGTSTLLVRRHDGLNWAVLFNAHANPDGKALGGLIDPLVHRAANAVKHWPKAGLSQKGK